MFLLILLFIDTSVYLLALSNSIRYYSYEDIYGPFTSNFILLTTFILLAITLYTCAIRFEKLTLLTCLTIILFVLCKYFFPDFFDRFYAFSFYDAGGHMIRGKYVTLTGHSNPEVDPYFDLQPGFFWTTAILLNIVGTPLTPNSPLFEFLTKYFEVLIATLYLPVLMYIMKSANVKSLGLAMLIVYGVNFTHLHYHAQAYADMLYWLLLSLLLSKTIERKTIFLIIMLGTAIVFVHQGVALVTLTSIASLASILILYEVLKRNSKVPLYRMLPTLTLLILVIWLAYLLYISKFYFPHFVFIVKDVVTRYLLEPGQPIASAVNRPYKPWEEVVLLKGLFMISVILLLILINLLLFIKSRELSYLSRTMIILSVTALVGAICLALGGAGYVERLMKWLAPLIAISWVNTNYSKRSSSHVLIHLLLISAILLGTLFYFSGRNFQSIAYSERAHGFVLDYDPNNIACFYSTIKVTSTEKAIELLIHSETPQGFVAIDKHAIIQALYYLVGNETLTEKYLKELISQGSIIFSSPTSLLLLF
ncbi:MAG: hypothetical protein NDP16_05625 [Crenarchaeota archaeon]|nr:hypothetical protein [Thermoproteota archaeon]